MTQGLSVASIRTDGGTQSRDALIDLVADSYAEDMENGASFPPVIVYFDGEAYWLADGFHRLKAAIKAGFETITADIRQGTRRDAVLYSVGANASHGQPRSNADKRRVVMTLLTDAEWSKWSDREIARQCAVSQPFVSKLRSEVEPTDNGYQSRPIADSDCSGCESRPRKSGDGRTINTANIGVKVALKPEPPTNTNTNTNGHSQHTPLPGQRSMLDEEEEPEEEEPEDIDEPEQEEDNSEPKEESQEDEPEEEDDGFGLSPPPATSADSEVWASIIQNIAFHSNSLRRRGGFTKLAASWSESKLRLAEGACDDVIATFTQYKKDIQEVRTCHVKA